MQRPSVTKEALQKHMAEEQHGHRLGPYIQDIVYGGNDGIVTTFAMVAVTAGADAPNFVIIVAGLGSLFADATSMATGAWLSLRSERDQYRRLRREEYEEIKNHPELERAEIRHFMEKKGFKDADLQRATEIITSDKKVWVDTMMAEEHGMAEEAGTKAEVHGTITFLSFVFFGSIPLLPYVFDVDKGFIIAIVSSFAALGLLGLTRSYVTHERLIRGPLEIMGIGAVGGVVAYIIGIILKQAFGVII